MGKISDISVFVFFFFSRDFVFELKFDIENLSTWHFFKLSPQSASKYVYILMKNKSIINDTHLYN